MLPFHVDREHKVITVPGRDIPMLHWPDGQWCIEANIYMLELVQRGLSRKNRGGTLLSYGTNISHLIRYCFHHKTNFIDLTDNQFTEFICDLAAEKDRFGNAVRESNAVILIGHCCLDFLKCVGRFHSESNFLGKTGRIRTQEKELKIQADGTRWVRNSIVVKQTHHRSFPTASAFRKRLPISSEHVESLRQAVLAASKSVFRRKRRYVMIRLLEITGGRRSEVSGILVKSVIDAATMTNPELTLPTAKQRNSAHQTRTVPVSRSDLAFLLEYIEKNRRRVVRETCGASNDDGFLLISEKTGAKLQPNTITQEIHELAKVAGLKEQTCPHMFRHRFITKLFVALIEQHNCQTVDDFRRALIDGEGLKQRVMQWTGQRSMKSLDGYIHLAFDEVAQFKVSVDSIRAASAIEGLKRSLESIKNEMGQGLTPEEASKRLLEAILTANQDLDAYAKGKDRAAARE
ncbi:MAG: site-specific integrase [Betaproteobacteria bacterium]|nr:site-specific integrase [Betaproteobacteria bacterium]